MKTPAECERSVESTDKSPDAGNNERLEKIIDKMIHSRDPEVIRETYREWAGDYDSDLDAYGYVAPQLGSEILLEHLTDQTSLILDAGCGTGLVGECLASHGLTNIHGTDFSDAMLEKAHARKIYASLNQSDFTKSINADDQRFDAVISIGVYKDIFSGVLISEMLRVCKAGGVLVFTARPVYTEQAVEEMQSLVRGGLEMSFTSRVLPYMTGQKADATYFVVVKRG